MPAQDPIAFFQEWFADARAREKSDSTAMALATADPQGRPAVRMVLLKHVDERGFVFYTNLESPKADDLRDNPRAALCFHWAVLERQVRIAGRVGPVSAAEADAYFATRPRLSQLALRFPVGVVPRPPYWSGYRVTPEVIEFWHERPFRHHDRQRFTREGEGWRHEWLFP
jgi:pyridoxamine 5'-phosphate oxidase